MGLNWISLKNTSQLDEIVAESKEAPVLIYKHSTRCNISRAALDRLERKWDNARLNIKKYYLDLLSFRSVSDLVAKRFEVEHHSPQVLLISDGRSVLDLSHFDIDFDLISSALAEGNR